MLGRQGRKRHLLDLKAAAATGDVWVARQARSSGAHRARSGADGVVSFGVRVAGRTRSGKVARLAAAGSVGR